MQCLPAGWLASALGQVAAHSCPHRVAHLLCVTDAGVVTLAKTYIHRIKNLKKMCVKRESTRVRDDTLYLHDSSPLPRTLPLHMRKRSHPTRPSARSSQLPDRNAQLIALTTQVRAILIYSTVAHKVQERPPVRSHIYDRSCNHYTMASREWILILITETYKDPPSYLEYIVRWPYTKHHALPN